MKKVIMAAAIGFGLVSNANAETIHADTLWGIQQVSLVCSAQDLGATTLPDDYFELVGKIDDLIGEDYEPNPVTKSEGMRHATRAMFDPMLCVNSYARVVMAVDKFEKQS